MTEIEEVAAAIYAKYQLAWPLNRAQAAALADLEAGDQGANIIAAIAECLFNYNAKRDDQRESDQAFNRQQLFTRACKALGLNEDENSWFDIVGQIEKSANPGPAEPFTAQLFDVLKIAISHQIHITGLDGETPGAVDDSSPVGNAVRLYVYADLEFEYDFYDQPVTVDANGQCLATMTNGAQVFLRLSHLTIRPLRASDLEKPDGTGN